MTPTTIRHHDPVAGPILERPYWTGSGLVFSAEHLAAQLDAGRFERPGVFVLTTDGLDGIPETVAVAPLRELAATAARLAGRWRHGVAFVHRDDALGGAHSAWLSAHLAELLKPSLTSDADTPLHGPGEGERAELAVFAREIRTALAEGGFI